MVNCTNLKSTDIVKLLSVLLEDNRGIELLKQYDPDMLKCNVLMLGDDDFTQSLRVRGLSLELTNELGRLSVEDEDMDLITDACHEIYDRCISYWAGRALSGQDSHVWLQCDPKDALLNWGPEFEDGTSVDLGYALKVCDFEVLDWLINPLWISCMVLPDPQKKVTNVMKTAGFYALQGLLAVKPMSYVELFLNEKLTDFLLSVQAGYGLYSDIRIGAQKAFCDVACVGETDIWMQDDDSFESWREDFIREQMLQRDELLLKQLYVVEDRQTDFNDGYDLLRQFHYNEHMSESEIKILGKNLAADPRLKQLLHHTLFQMSDFSTAILRIASNDRMFLLD